MLMNAVRCGVASIIPAQLLGVLTAQDLSLRVCGLPIIDLDYLKVRLRLVGFSMLFTCSVLVPIQRHTMYQVGLMESDKHVQFFWNALESFSQVLSKTPL